VVEFAAQVSEFVYDGRLGFAADLASFSASVLVFERELAAPESWAMAVAFVIAAGPRCSKEIPCSPRRRRVAMTED
jgi:hypothetical protein